MLVNCLGLGRSLPTISWFCGVGDVIIELNGLNQMEGFLCGRNVWFNSLDSVKGKLSDDVSNMQSSVERRVSKGVQAQCVRAWG